MICDHFGVCGGCSRQNEPYESQLAAKQSEVKAALAGLEVASWRPILPSPAPFFYRNKMEFSFGDVRDIEILNRPKAERRSGSPVVTASQNRVHLGLHPKGRYAIVTPTPGCLLLSTETGAILSAVSRWATERSVPVFVRKNGEGDLRHLVIREGKNTGDRLVNLVARSRTQDVPALAEALKECGAPITTFLWSAYDGASDVAGADNRKVFWGDGAIREKLGRVTFTVTPSTFMQTNTAAAERMLDLLRAWIAEDGLVEGRRTLIDLYCGTGAIGLNLAPLFDEAVGIELNPDSVVDAWRTAKENGITNARFIQGKAEEAALPFFEPATCDGATVVVDPPRNGLHADLVEALLRWEAPRLYYVSCNPASLARDLQLLAKKYRIVEVQPMDFFPHTDHVETAVRLRRSV